MDPLLRYAQEHQGEIIALIREFVECESPSDDRAACGRFAELFAARIADIAKVKKLRGGHLRCEFRLPGRGKDGQIMGLGHMDTVWPVGTLRTMPWREAGGRLWGPGVFDMKAGLAFFVYAMRGLRELDIRVGRRVVLQVNADEETGSDSSRAFTEELARDSVAVLVAEPAAGLDGKLKTARKGVGEYRIAVKGVASHSGLDFAAGASAVVELARQIERIAEFTDLDRGITVNPGIVHGGTRVNVVAAEAYAEVDMRIAKLRDAAVVDRKFRALRAADRRCSVEVTGGLNRPPLERTPGVVRLFRHAQKLSRELGIDLGETAVGGGSDGNFTAALGVPTLDGLGPVGEGAHAANESILIDRIADRTALLGKLVASL